MLDPRRHSRLSLAPTFAILLPLAISACGSGAATTATTAATDDAGDSTDGASPLDSSSGNGDSGIKNDAGATDGASKADGANPVDGAAPLDGSSPADGSAPALTTVFTIVLENTDYASIIGSANAPYLNGLIAQNGLATNYMDSGSHPSLPNYLYMVSGNTQYPGILDLDPTQSPFPVAGDNLGNQLTVANIPWRSYQESSGTPCLLSGSGTYAPKHDPFLYFSDNRGSANSLCAATNVDYSSFAADLAAGTYRYMWITPNLNDDGHDTNLQTADTWASTEIPKILASTAYKNGGVLFITWDEGEGTFGTTDHVPMIIVSPRIKSAGFKSAVAYTHASYLATVETIFGLPLLGAAALPTKNMMEFFQ